MAPQHVSPLILGGTGWVGQALARVWKDAPPVWQHRPQRPAPAAPALVWDMHSPAPTILQPISGIIVLAGVTDGDAAQLAQNTTLALAACDLAAQVGGVPVLVASSQAVYGPQTGLLSEDHTCAPSSPYGVAKLAMETAVAGRPNVTCLRIGNVAGADMLMRAASAGPVKLDQFADGQGPERAYIGPVTLAQVLAGLLAAYHAGTVLPRVLNVASPGMIAMQDVLTAAGARWSWRPAAAQALRALALDVSRLSDIVPLAPDTATGIIAQARTAGWSPAA